jgi:hypothetical protein
MGRGNYIGGNTVLHSNGFGFSPLEGDGGYKPRPSELTQNQKDLLANAKNQGKLRSAGKLRGVRRKKQKRKAKKNAPRA